MGKTRRTRIGIFSRGTLKAWKPLEEKRRRWVMAIVNVADGHPGRNRTHSRFSLYTVQREDLEEYTWTIPYTEVRVSLGSRKRRVGVGGGGLRSGSTMRRREAVFSSISERRGRGKGSKMYESCCRVGALGVCETNGLLWRSFLWLLFYLYSSGAYTSPGFYPTATSHP